MSADPSVLISKAERKEAPSSRISSWFSGGDDDRYEEAAELYTQAANMYKIQKDMHNAGKTYERAAKALEKAKSMDNVATTLVEAYKSYRQTDPEDGIRVLKRASEIFTLQGQFRRAANLQMDLAALYENQSQDDLAIESYDIAGDWYYQDQAEAISNKAFLKVADLAALNKDYARAVDRYERVAKQCLNSNLTKWGVKEYFLKAGLCRVAEQDVVSAENSLQQYIEMDPSFESMKEFQLLQNVINAVKQQDEQDFSDKIYEYDQYKKLDPLHTKILLRIKEQIQSSGDDLL